MKFRRTKMYASFFGHLVYSALYKSTININININDIINCKYPTRTGWPKKVSHYQIMKNHIKSY